jgi:hypothetical protein
MGILAGVLLLVGLVVWVLRKPRIPSEPQTWEDAVEPPDADALEAAEREVRDLDVHQRPEEGFEGDDWGPGTKRG